MAQRGWLVAADIGEQPEVLAKVLPNNSERLDAARDALRGARVVRFAGLGSSKHAAGYGATCMEIVGGRPATVLSAPGARVELPAPQATEPLVVVSQSGRTPSLVELALRTRSSGAPVISVTNAEDGPLVEAATANLFCGAGPERVVAATKSVTTQCLLLRALASMPTDDETTALVFAARRALSLDASTVVSGPVPPSAVAAGFAAEWVADEIALKLIEMCGVPVTSEAVVEHFHGPRASGARVLAFLDPKDPNSGELARDPGVITVGPHPAFHLETPSTGEVSLDAILALVVGQSLARAWSLATGEDPDADRGLQKVTHTR